MRIRAVLGGILGSVTVLVIGWQAGAAAAHNAAATETTNSASTSTSTSTDSTSSSASTSTPSSTSSPSPSASSTSTSKGATGKYTGSTAQTPFGPVQVEIVVSNGKITDVKALQLTDQGGRSVEISNYAAPILRQEVLSAQSAKVSSVGGATYTSQGYISSLQSALDKANL